MVPAPSSILVAALICFILSLIAAVVAEMAAAVLDVSAGGGPLAEECRTAARAAIVDSGDADLLLSCIHEG